MGSPPLARTVLSAMCEATLAPIAVYTQPDRPAGRGKRVQPSAVKQEALKRGIELFQPERFRSDEVVGELSALAPDLLVVAAYGLILPQRVIDIPRLGAINVHTSLLPTYRGAAPIQAALLNGDSTTGVTMMQIDAGMDTGDIIAQRGLDIGPNEDAISLSNRLAHAGAEMTVEILRDYPDGGWTRTPQEDASATLAPKLKKEDGRLDFNLPAQTLHNQVRALVEWPTAFITRPEGPLRILEAHALTRTFSNPGTLAAVGPEGVDVACPTGTLRIVRLQAPGKKPTEARAWLNGARLRVGDRIGVEA